MKKNGRRGAINHGSDRRRGLQALLLERDGDLCWLCSVPIISREENDPLGLSIDHVIPVSNGGSNHVSNLRLAHRICNSMRVHSLPK